ncbi:insulin-degrading enzyme, putative [Ichthyophthirius multifiliis]|uniref:Insulin-degrading enzyme, putative n=1 Tax=Ichthyophthirius multifiliis TaxID=5932 RepID=G0QSA9_ICHMU|nr:insulin-degrading enzyme, putative [Ichthyophthirius multifiliis]EGR31907.1 insulin-degrading enzyme, putative [Ichthyophthirius multifiliis]|eukprot:XP_004035393.1 insulin-degrading enzyme, putative [Ichthyophthirius multifiliis]
MKFVSVSKHSNIPGEIDIFLGNNQGNSNAYTDSLNTNYFFNVHPNAFQQALVYFSHMFFDHKYKQKNVEKEINAIHSEYLNTLNHNNYIDLYFYQIISNQNHFFSNFTCGNNKTLNKDNILKELIQFEKENYKSNKMSLVLYGKESLDQLKEYTKEAEFEKIPQENSKNEELEYKQNSDFFKKIQLFNNVIQQKKNYINNNKKKRKHMEIYIKYKDQSYINYIQSIFQKDYYYYLLNENYIQSLYFVLINEILNLYQLQISLTQKGILQIEFLLSSFFEYFRKFKISKKNYENAYSLSIQQFNFEQKNIQQDYISDLAKNLNNLKFSKSNTILQKKTIYEPFDEKQLYKLLQIFQNPLKCIYIFKTSDFKPYIGLKTDFFEIKDSQYEQEVAQFNLKYSKIGKIKDKNMLLNSINGPKYTYQLNFSKMPTKFSLVDVCGEGKKFVKSYYLFLLEKIKKNIYDEKQDLKPYIYNEQNFRKQCLQKIAFPLVLEQNKKYKIFYLIEKKMPKIQFLIHFFNNKNIHDIYNQQKLEIYSKVLSSYFDSIFEDNYLVNFSIESQSTIYGFQLQISGWSDGFGEVFGNVFDLIQSFKVNDEEGLSVLKEQIIFEYENQNYNIKVLDDILQEKLFLVLDSSYVPLSEKINLFSKINCKVLNQISFSENYYFDVLFSGNLQVEKALSYTKNMFEKLKINTEFEKMQDIILKIGNLKGKNLVFQSKNQQENDQNNYIVNIYQIGKREEKDIIYNSLIIEKMNSFLYKYLRTDLTLGYIAKVQSLSIGCVDYLAVIQSGDKKQASDVDLIIEEGLHLFIQQLKSGNEEEFQKDLQNLKEKLEKPQDNHEDLITMYWNKIIQQNYGFRVLEHYLEIIQKQKITKKGLAKFLNRVFQENKGKVSFQVFPYSFQGQIKQSDIPQDFIQCDFII